MKIGFIGLGIMGSRMASNLIAAGHELVVWNRTKEKMEPLRKKGAQTADTPADAAKQVNVLVTMLAAPQAVRETALGEQGFLEALGNGSLWIDSSTVDPAFSREMAAEAKSRGIRFVDAPVAGTKGPAEKGELIVLAGGSGDDLREAEPIFGVIGKKTVHAGGTGMGASLKMVVNLMLAHGMLAYTEALMLGSALGLSNGKVADTLLGGPVTPPFLSAKREKIETGDYEPEFPLRLMTKDLHLALLSAYEHGTPLPSTAAVKEAFMTARQKGLGDLDFSAIYRALAE